MVYGGEDKGRLGQYFDSFAEKKHVSSMPSIIDLIESGVGIEHFKEKREQQLVEEDDQYLMVDESMSQDAINTANATAQGSNTTFLERYNKAHSELSNSTLAPSSLQSNTKTTKLYKPKS